MNSTTTMTLRTRVPTQRRGNHNFEEHINTDPMEENFISYESCTQKSADNISIKEEFNDNVVYITDKDESMNDNNINSSEGNQVTNEYECPICHEYFIESENLINHMKRSHTKILSDIQKAQCPICSKILRLYNLKRHLKSHIGIKDFHCSICNDSFRAKDSLICHMKIHSREKEYQCLICKKNFLWKRSLNKHIKAHCKKKDDAHSEAYNDENEKHLSFDEKCNENLEEVSTKDKSISETNVKSNSTDYGISTCFECPICHKLFVERKNLVRHIERHTRVQSGKKSAQCPICSKFISQCNLKRHLKNHAGVKDFHCSICKKSFTTKNSLQHHLTTHAKIMKQFECDICHKQFNRKCSLAKHTKTHNQLHIESVNTEINSATLSKEKESEEIISPSQEALTENCNDLERNNIADQDDESTMQEKSDQKFKEIFISEEPIEDFTSDSYFNDSKKRIEDESASLASSGQKLKENIKENLTDSQFQCYDISVKKESIEENSNDRAFYDEILQDAVKDETIINNNVNSSEDNLSNIDLKCLICRKLFLGKENFIRHMKSHTKIKSDKNKVQHPTDNEEKNILSKEDNLKDQPNDRALCANVTQSTVENESVSSDNINCSSKNSQSTVDFACPICCELFLEEGSLIIHLKTHIKIGSDENKPQCPICNNIVNSSNVIRHFRIHLKSGFSKREKKTQCPKCSKFIYTSYMKKHLNLHTRISEFNCSVCNKSFLHKNSLKCHMKIHADVNKDFECEDEAPGTKNLNEESVSFEKELLREKSKDLSFECSSIIEESGRCDQNVEELYIKEEPMEGNSSGFESFTENIEKGILVKEQIPEEITNDLECNDNVQQKTKDKSDNYVKYECPTCHKLFIESEHLMKHLKIKTHINIELNKSQRDKPKAQCCICGKFVDPCIMKRHLKSHAGIKDYHCSVCNKAFSRKESLSYHLATHTGRKDFQCEICNETFVTKQNLNHHKKNHKRKL